VRIDADGHALVLENGEHVPYDRLILAAGARHHYFGHPEWESRAPGLKTLEDALVIRNRFLDAFERAERETDDAVRDGWMTVVVVGGGPTGVELAGVLPSMLRRALAPEFRLADLTRARVILVEAGDRLLPSFGEKSSARARRDLERLGVEVRTGETVTAVESDHVRIGDERIPTHTVFWAAGNRASPLTADLGVDLRRDGRIAVGPDLSVPGRPEIFAVGDLAWVPRGDGEVPAIAPAAVQMGHAAAAAVRADLAGRERPDFRYVDKGSLATIGRHRAVAEFGSFRFAGVLAWWVWLFVHILYLVGFRNRASVMLEWAYAYWTYQRGVRLITRIEKDSSREE